MCKVSGLILVKNVVLKVFYNFFKDKKSFLKEIKIFIKSLELSNKNYLVIYPNNDYGNDLIISNYNKILKKNKKFTIIKSFRFEYFLTLLKNSEFIIGNSSAGVREAPIYGVPTINVGNRQKNRFTHESITNVDFNVKKISQAINNSYLKKFRLSKHFGNGNSSELIYGILKKDKVWKITKQKQMIIHDI